MAAQDLLDLLRDFSDRMASRHYCRIEVGKQPAHSAGQAHSQELRRRGEDSEGVQSARRNSDRRAWPKIDRLILNLDNHAAAEDVKSLSPWLSVQWGCRATGRIHFEELIAAVCVSGIDLDGDDSVRRAKLGTFASGS